MARETSPHAVFVPDPPRGGPGRPPTGEDHRALGRWLRQQRLDRAWDRLHMARRLAQAAGQDRGGLPDMKTLRMYVARWEAGSGGVSERYRLLYAAALGIPPAQFGPPPLPPPRPRRPRPANAPVLLTPAQVAGRFGVDAKTVTKWARDGKITSIRTLGGHRRYSQAEVEELLRARAR